MELNIEKFSPKRAELVTLAESYKTLTVTGVDDKAGIVKLVDARKDLRNKRIEIEKTGKELRADALAFQKEVIKAERELVAIIEPVEDSLVAKIEQIEKEKQKLKMVEMLPLMREKLLSIDVEVEDEFLLTLSEDSFAEFFMLKNREFFDKKQREIEDQQKKQQEEIDKKQRQLEEEKEKIKVEKEKMENEKKRLEKKEVEKPVEPIQPKNDIGIAEVMVAFAKENGVTEENKDDFIIKKFDTAIVLYKKIAVKKI